MNDSLQLTFPLPSLGGQGGLYTPRKAEMPPSRKLTRTELIFIRTGSLQIENCGLSLSVPAGRTAILKPGWVHGTEESEVSYYWVQFDRPAADGGGPRLMLGRISTPQRPERLADLFHSYIEAQEAGWADPAEESLALYAILREAALAIDPLARPSSLRLAGKVLAFIKQNALKGISTSTLAAELDVDPDHMGRVFRRVYGKTITGAIHEQQLRIARGLLRESTRKIGEIARLCGFDDPGYFRRVFDAAHGLSPRKYRKLHRRTDLDEG